MMKKQIISNAIWNLDIELRNETRKAKKKTSYFINKVRSKVFFGKYFIIYEIMSLKFTQLNI